MKEKLIRFMIGRNGVDKLSKTALYLSIVFIFAGMFFRNNMAVGNMLRAISAVALVYSYFRILSKNIYKRREENEKYIRFENKIFERFRILKERWVQRKDYKFFTCPGCKSTMRVPKGKGKVNIVCRKCGRSFMGKT